MDKPGCFGHIATYDPKVMVCGVCEYNAACAESVQNRIETLKRLHQYPDIPETLPARTEVLRERLPKVEMTVMSDLEAPTGTMTKKAKEIARGLAKRGIDLNMAVLGGYNPVDTPRFVKHAVDFLLTEGINKRQLKEYYKKTFDWTEATAASHVGIVASLFVGLGVATVDGQDLKKRTL